MTSTGIAVFAYNRPAHLEQVLSGLRKNDVKHLYIFSDGPKNRQDKQDVEAVRGIIEDLDWCKKTVSFNDTNLGLAQSLISGIQRVFQENDRIIVLEDDCVPSPNFISYMNACLDQYANDCEVMNVNGYSPPITIPEDYPYDIFFTYRSSSWGWGTWKDAWEHYEFNAMTLSELQNNRKSIKQTTAKAGTDIFQMMRNQLTGEIDSWAVWWSYAIIKNNGLCVNPVQSKVSNIGHDGSGIHSGDSDKYNVDLDDTSVADMNFVDDPFVDNRINRRYNRFITGGYRIVLKQVITSVLKKLGICNQKRLFRREW